MPLTYLEQKRLEAQRQYLEEWEYLCQNKDSFDRIIKEEQEALAKWMPLTFWGTATAMPRKADYFVTTECQFTYTDGNSE